MDPGRLDRRVTLEELQAKADVFGQRIEQYVSIGEVWAEFLPVNGTERAAAGHARFDEATHRFRIRWRPGITVKHRVVCDGVTYGIVGILEIGRRDGLELMAAASAAEPPRD